MPACSICGASRERLVSSVIEGAVIIVCEECAKFGKIVSGPRIVKEKPMTGKIEEIEFVEEGYNDKVRRARERKKLTQEELAKNLAEKESTIHGVESGKLKPDLKLARKLEVFLGIDITAKDFVNPGTNKKIDFKDRGLTIGDLLKMNDDN